MQAALRAAAVDLGISPPKIFIPDEEGYGERFVDRFKIFSSGEWTVCESGIDGLRPALLVAIARHVDAQMIGFQKDDVTGCNHFSVFEHGALSILLTSVEDDLHQGIGIDWPETIRRFKQAHPNWFAGAETEGAEKRVICVNAVEFFQDLTGIDIYSLVGKTTSQCGFYSDIESYPLLDELEGQWLPWAEYLKRT